MASSGPVPVTIFSDSGAKKTTSKKTRTVCAHKFITRVDGPGQYLRFAFNSKTLEEANSVLAELHNSKIIDSIFSHAYTRNKNGELSYSIHGIAHITSRDYDFNFMRRKLPKASIRVSYYPEGTYPPSVFKKKTTQTVIQEGCVPNNTCVYNSIDNTGFGAELPSDNSFPSFN
ncbi:MAG: hypothetical protein IKC11_01650 [Clostridia bacterium]|nr:hypothetical protein [Clostridia bacterium]